MKKLLVPATFIMFILFSGCSGDNGTDGVDASLSVENLGTLAGNAGDTDPASFHFNTGNQDFLMQTSYGENISTANVAFAYGTHMALFVDGKDMVSETGLKIIGADLSGSNMANPAFPGSGSVAIDNATGRLKFSPIPQWKEEAVIQNVINHQQSVHVEMNNKGMAVAVYVTQEETKTRMYGIIYTPGLGWQEPEPIDLDDDYGASIPQVSINETGDAIVVFRQRVTGATYYKAYATRYDAATLTWLPAEHVGTDNDLGHATSIDVDLNDNGNAVCVFTKKGAHTFDSTYANIFLKSGGWQGAEVIDDDSGDACIIARVALNNNNRAVCVYRQYLAGNVVLRANQVTIGETWEGPTSPPISANFSTGHVQSHQVVISPDNDVVVIFSQSSGGIIRLFSSMYYSDAWDTPSSDADAIDNAAAITQNEIGLDMSASGNAVCTFSHDATLHTYSRHYDASSHSWDQATGPLNVNGDHSLTAVNSSGNAFIVFIDAENRIRHKDFNGTEDRWSYSEQTISTGEPDEIAIAMNDHGEKFILFTRDNRLYSTGWQRDIPVEGSLSVRYYAPTASE